MHWPQPVRLVFELLLEKSQRMIHVPVVHPVHHAQGKHILAPGDAFIVEPEVLESLTGKRSHRNLYNPVILQRPIFEGV